MSLAPRKRQRIIHAIDSLRLRLDPAMHMYASYGTGRLCDGCREEIESSHIEYECVYLDGSAHVLHLACAALLDAEQRRREAEHHETRMEKAREDAHRLRQAARRVQDDARDTAKKSGQIRDQADVLSREAEVVRAESRQIKRGELVSLRGVRILLVEYHAERRESLTRLLLTVGAIVLDAATPLDALPLVPMADVVVTAVGLADEEARWLLEQINSGAHRLPMVGMTPMDAEHLPAQVLDAVRLHRG